MEFVKVAPDLELPRKEDVLRAVSKLEKKLKILDEDDKEAIAIRCIFRVLKSLPEPFTLR